MLRLLDTPLLRHRARRDPADPHRATECVNRAAGALAAALLLALPLLAPHTAAGAEHLLRLYTRGAAAYADAATALAHAPGGLKLHPTLATFLGTHLSHLVHAHSTLCTTVARAIIAAHTALATAAPLWARVPAAIGVIVVGAALGASGLLDAAGAVLLVAHAHAAVAGAALAAAWGGTRRVLQCLGRLFRGRKWNPLRARVDSCRYALDELLAGTLLFVLLCCLAPTVLAYHVLATLARAPVLLAALVLSAAARTFQAFPVARAAAWLARAPSVPRVTVYAVVATPGSPSSSPCIRPQERVISFWRATTADLLAELAAWHRAHPPLAALRFLLLAE